MASRDGYNGKKAVTSILAANLSGNGTTTKGLAVDTLGYESALAVVAIGAPGDTLSASLLFTVKLMESATTADADFSAVAVADMVGGSQGAAGEIAVENGATGANGSCIAMAGYRGSKRYLRVDVVRTGNNATGTPLSATIVLDKARDAAAGSAAAGAALT